MPDGGHHLCGSVGPAPHLAPTILAKILCPVLCLASGMPQPQDDHHCVRTVAPWKAPHLRQGLGLTFRRKVITTDVSNSGWGALCEGRPAFSS